MRRLLLALVLAAWASSAAAQTLVDGKIPQLPPELGPNGGLKMECIAGTCTGSGGPAPDVNVTNATLAVTQSGAWAVSFGAPQHVIVDSATLGTVAVSGTFWQATQPVSGTFWQATQPVSGTFFQATQPVSNASLPLPSNAAQETGGNLAAVLAALVAVQANQLAILTTIAGTTDPAKLDTIAGRTTENVYYPLPLVSGGQAVSVQLGVAKPLPLARCNNVRRINCQVGGGF